MSSIQDSVDIISKIYNKYKIKIESACFSNGYIPEHIILDRTRNIHSYLTFIKVEQSRIRSEVFDLNNDYLVPLIEYVKVQYSQLDRPLFFIFLDELGEVFGVDASDVRIQLLENGGNDIIHFINNNKIHGQQLFTQIKKEL